MKASMLASRSSGKSAQEEVGFQCMAALCMYNISNNIVASCQDRSAASALHNQGSQIRNAYTAFWDSAFVEFANSLWACSDAGKFGER